jgi:hypothetical protein
MYYLNVFIVYKKHYNQNLKRIIIYNIITYLFRIIQVYEK